MRPVRIGVGASRTAWYMAGMQKQDLDDLFAALATMATVLNKVVGSEPVSAEEKTALKTAATTIARLRGAPATPPAAVATPAPGAPPDGANPFMQVVDQNPPPGPVAAVPVARPGAGGSTKVLGPLPRAPKI